MVEYWIPVQIAANDFFDVNAPVLYVFSASEGVSRATGQVAPWAAGYVDVEP